jgi:hypothetical protein
MPSAKAVERVLGNVSEAQQPAQMGVWPIPQPANAASQSLPAFFQTFTHHKLATSQPLLYKQIFC